MMIFATRERLTYLSSLVLGAALLTIASAFWTGFAPAPPIQVTLSVMTSATPTDSFVAALARGDLAAADQVASPLYAAEWSRRGLSISDRMLLSGAVSPASRLADRQLAFSYVGRAEDDQGFRHLLYLERPVDAAADAPSAVWRIDTDPAGAVIWSELVYLVEANPATLRIVAPRDEAPPLPAQIRALHGRLATGVRSASGPEGYFAAFVEAPPGEKGTASAAEGLVFFAIDADGGARPGVWSYGQADTAAVPYGQAFKAPPPVLDRATAAAQQRYLAALGE
jgi:hypothetical protein